MPALFKNNATATIAASITNTDTTIVLSAGLGNTFPLPSGSNYFYATLFDNVGNYEIVKCTARVTDTLTVVRAQDNTNPLPFNAGSGFAMRPVAAIFNNLVQLDGAQVISGSKTFSSAIIVSAGVSATTVSASSGFTGNLNGNVTGNVTGNITGNVNGNVTGTLTGNVVGNADTATTANSIANTGAWNVTFSSSNDAVVVGGIATNVLTVASVTSGTLTSGQILSSGTTPLTTKAYSSGGASGASTIVLVDVTSLVNGLLVTGTGVPASTTITNISGNTITLSNPLTVQAAGTYSFFQNSITTGTKVLSQTTATGAAVVTTKAFAAGGASGQNNIQLNSVASVVVGQFITGTGVPAGTTIIGINYPETNYVTLSANLTTQAAGNYEFRSAGGIGTYTVSESQTIAAGTSITAASKKVNFVYNGDTVFTVDANGNVFAAGLVQAGAAI